MKILKPDDIQELNSNLFNADEVDSFLQQWYPESDVSSVPYSAEDGQPRVMLGWEGSYCSLELPVTGADVLYYATLLVVFGKD